MNQIPVQLPDLDYAAKWQRAIHCLVDSALGLIALGALLKFLLPFFPDPWLEALRDMPERRLSLLLNWSGLLLFYLATEVAFKTTPGKLLTRTAVCDAEGFSPTRLRLLGRTMARLIPLDWLSFFGRDGTGWHDAASKTYVVRKILMKPATTRSGG
ncbi:hypothetical protein OKA05_07235 [Luteolibacter arcticus]|uniref:RDD family protein n=1 Tax=Luteolibacter arcticus TaxID=1581411 RepID=A0ABT3GFV5_9BACT|nr:hypothetical protein [Luteolibacter arcticus]MCW1922341.1 hypothetical protein [Luteolibacter arcticus]